MPDDSLTIPDVPAEEEFISYRIVRHWPYSYIELWTEESRVKTVMAIFSPWSMRFAIDCTDALQDAAEFGLDRMLTLMSKTNEDDRKKHRRLTYQNMKKYY